jgi:hypothetical protein
MFLRVVSYKLIDVSGAYCDHTDDGSSKYLWNVGQFLPDYTEQYPRRLPPSTRYSKYYHLEQ